MNSALPDRLRLLPEFDPVRLQQDLRVVEKMQWVNHFVPDNYSGSWTILPLRGPAGAVHPILMSYSNPNCTEFEDTPFLEHSAYFKQVLCFFECPVQSVRLMKLTPGSKIKTHTDFDLAFEQGTVRLHIPVTTNEQVIFRLNGKPVPMKEGALWYLRLVDPHSVENNGSHDRVHLVIDAEVNGWMRDLFNQAC